MVTRRLSNAVSFLRTTAIGGLIFLLPILVGIGLLGYLFQIVVGVHTQLQPWLPFDSMLGVVLLFVLSIVVLLLLSFAAGLVARRAIGVHFSKTVEKQLIKMFPKYGIYKELLASRIGGPDNGPSFTPVLVKQDGISYLAFQTDQLASGLLVVYFPGAPDTWNGNVALIPPELVEPLNAPFNEVLGICERLGRDSAAHLNVPLASALASSVKQESNPVSGM